jgi:hypothetical protein
VIANSVPVKKIASRTKKDRETVLYGPWQVTDVDVGEAVNGLVPKNDHGNVYLYKPEMMPKVKCCEFVCVHCF